MKVCGYKQSKQVGWPPGDDIRTADESTGWGGSWDGDGPEKRQQKPMDAVEMGEHKRRGEGQPPGYATLLVHQPRVLSEQDRRRNQEVRHFNPLTIKSSFPGTWNPSSFGFTFYPTFLTVVRFYTGFLGFRASVLNSPRVLGGTKQYPWIREESTGKQRSLFNSGLLTGILKQK